MIVIQRCFVKVDVVITEFYLMIAGLLEKSIETSWRDHSRRRNKLCKYMDQHSSHNICPRKGYVVAALGVSAAIPLGRRPMRPFSVVPQACSTL
jgi:hypothetical protein